MAQGLPALAAEQEAQGQDAGPRAGARRGLIPGIGSAGSSAELALFTCRNCGVVAHADRNASHNIARKGKAV
ncbi:zinc ribbon domain-containing protein [Streptomyces sp. NPDC057684]|uniref:zinc ribbon domain-containing protein n=1 Tax=unclassified Streptomyces TaxID=2593676 RepID=UPI0036BFF02F